MHSTHIIRVNRYGPDSDLDGPVGQRAHERGLVAGQRPAPAERAEERRMPDLGGGHVERL
jgi:hypothetical protein